MLSTHLQPSPILAQISLKNSLPLPLPRSLVMHVVNGFFSFVRWAEMVGPKKEVRTFKEDPKRELKLRIKQKIELRINQASQKMLWCDKKPAINITNYESGTTEA